MRKPILTVLTAALMFVPAVALAQTSAAKTTTPAATMPAAPMAMGAMINVNTASAADLTKIPGVNAKIAAEIIKNRPYKNAAELVKKVKGVGKKNVKKMIPVISF
jgi:competence protein ComEA